MVRWSLLVVAVSSVSACRGRENLPYQEARRPQLPLHAKTRRYQERLQVRFQTPEGLLRYARRLDDADSTSYGKLADGAFHTGIYLASQALRHAATRDPAAREEALRTLGALRLLLGVSGKHGLLARHFSPAGTVDGPHWTPSPSHPRYVFRADVSRDQYAGWIHGLGVALAVMDEPEVRKQVAELARAAADHLIDHRLRIIGIDGKRTEHGDLRGRIFFFPNGVNALIDLAVAKVAAETNPEERYRDFYRDLVKRGFPRLARWTRVPLFDTGKRVNANMAYLALYPLLLLERDPVVLEDLKRAERSAWSYTRGERNGFFSFVHAGAVEGRPARESPGPLAEPDGSPQGRLALYEFPEDKVEWPVDHTRPGSEFRPTFWSYLFGDPRSRSALALYLRPRSSSFWASNPYRLVGNLDARGDAETAAMDYLLAYWLGRYHGLVGAGE